MIGAIIVALFILSNEVKEAYDYEMGPEWQRVPVDANSRLVAQKACGPSYEMVEMGLIEGETKVVRFKCGGAK